MLPGQRDIQAEGHEDNEIFEEVVAERALKLGDKQEPEAAKTSLGSPSGFKLAWLVHVPNSP
jgi:hypothetical protein